MLLASPYAKRAATAGLADFVCFLTAAAAAYSILTPASVAPFHYVIAAIVGAALANVTLIYSDAYRSAVLGSARATLRALTTTMGLALAGGLALYFLAPWPPGFASIAAHTAAIFFPLLLVQRIAFRFVSSRWTDRVLIIGASHLGLAIAQALRERPGMGLELVGFASDKDELRHRSIEGFPVVGRVDQIEKLIERFDIDRIVVASKDREETFPAEQLLAAKLAGCRVESGVTFCEGMLGQIHLRDLQPSYLVFSEGLRVSRFSRVVTRNFDVLVASAALILTAPLLALAALAIRLDSRGPVFYWQQRVGRHGRIFQVIKLRTMVDGAEDHTGPVFASDDDERITRVGQILRQTRLDEVPQFWNVLKGEMSVVGPRPERPEFVESLTDRYPLFRLRSAVKPGVTGWAQIRYGYVSELEAFEQKLSLDLFYLKHRTLVLDLVILWATIKTVLLFRGL